LQLHAPRPIHPIPSQGASPRTTPDLITKQSINMDRHILPRLPLPKSWLHFISRYSRCVLFANLYKCLVITLPPLTRTPPMCNPPCLVPTNSNACTRLRGLGARLLPSLSTPSQLSACWHQRPSPRLPPRKTPTG
jgi:hypothetical protein